MVPVRQTDDFAKDWWLARHQQKIAERLVNEKPIDLVFLGDSITHAWEYTAPEVWHKYYGDRNALNLGFDGDRTENLLWRIQNGELDGISPKLLVLLIGTNNAGHRQDSSKHTARGVKAILDELQSRLPTSKILLMAIFPRSKKPSQQLRVLVDGSNQLIKQYVDDKHILWMDINHQFLDPQGILHESIMPDFLHPNEAQYEVWASAIEATMKRLLAE
jgi:beta-glucosidase